MGHHVAAPTVRQRLAGVRHLFDWLVAGLADEVTLSEVERIRI